MKCPNCGCILISNNSLLYIHEKSDVLVPGDSLSGWIYTDKKGHTCPELWFGYYENHGAVFTCVGYPHEGKD